ncbi:hypothetical protein CLV47_102287 [Antricoccus suffuscus]|uniref:Uncharacterized protein n=1 Tax=Antricoccus suffuscus TaxID=1629062 RepID=A0A2T1A536_9ACTN|nr:hypothetical protein [Antricoccus suffuscus]PRZ43597.1 hypothetical protein CLV47_102287 [Antricoccus suffuscus]
MSSSGVLRVFTDDIDAERVFHELTAEGIGDGLPVIPPTQRRIDAMLETVDQPESNLGLVPPLYAELTAWKTAYFSVMSGISPAEFPIVLTAVHACLEEQLNLLGVQTTTGTAAVGVAVHGPVCRQLGLNSGSGCMDGTAHPNVRIGRAVSLVLRGVGGATPGELDMATMGQPGKVGMCFAHEVTSALSSFHGSESAVTVFAFSGTAEVLPLGDCNVAEDILRPLAESVVAARLAMGAPLKRLPNDEILVVPPEIVALLEKWGVNLNQIYERLRSLTSELLERRSRELGLEVNGTVDMLTKASDLRVLVAGGTGIKMTYLPTWKGGSRSVTRPLTATGVGAL